MSLTSIKRENMDLTVNPGTDFYQYAAGHWLDNNPRDMEYSAWNNFCLIDHKVDEQLHKLIEDLVSQPCEEGSFSQKARDLYNLYCDAERLNREGYSPILPTLKMIDDCKSNQDIIDFIAKKHRSCFMSTGLGQNLKDSSRHIIYISQGVRNPSDFLSDNPNSVKVREIRKENVRNLLMLMDTPEEEAQRMTELYYSTITELANDCMSLVDQRDPSKSFNIYAYEDLKRLTPDFDWDRYFTLYGYEDISEVNVQSAKAIIKACRMMKELPLETLKTVLRVLTVRNAASLMGDKFFEELHNTRKKLSGDCNMRPRDKRAFDFAIGTIGEVIAQIYVEKHFPKENKEKAVALVMNLKKAFAERIRKQTWMSEKTKELALEKLDRMQVKIGYPDKWDDLSELTVDPKLSLYENVENIRDFYWRFSKEKFYNKPVDKTLWAMMPTTVNACYTTTCNDITFPAAILQAPFFDMSADDAYNYGAIGAIIGHEMTHGFDDSGRKFDKDGNLSDWWTKEDAEAFGKVCGRMSAFHDGITVLPELKCNGKLTLGEDIADQGGLKIAFSALREVMKEKDLGIIDGLTPEQRFFIAYATDWAGYQSEEGIRMATLNDCHSIPQIRVNAALQQIDEWYEAFSIKPGDPLYLSPEERISVW